MREPNSSLPSCNALIPPPASAAAPYNNRSDMMVSEHTTNLVRQVLQDKQLQHASFRYIQAVELEQGACIASNCLRTNQVEIAPIASGWAIGRSPTCAIRSQHNSISRCHAILAYQPEVGFYMTDLGSSNGTWLNSQRLQPMQRYVLDDCDRLRIGKLIVTFYMARCADKLPMRVCDETYSGAFARC
ncbi:MAG: FHA domain-containing protein [Cyanobacteria bacterium J06638_22]